MTNSPDPDCIFCKIVGGQIPAGIVFQNDQVTAFRDVNAQMQTRWRLHRLRFHGDAGGGIGQLQRHLSRTISVDGQVVNHASAAVSLVTVDVTVPGSVYPAAGFVGGVSIAPGASAPWHADAFVQAASRPTSATAAIGYWSWDDYRFAACATIGG